ncbi:MAG TPA: hypothetical protein VGK93_05160, partial [Candidatus Eisenbacteria bacterium]
TQRFDFARVPLRKLASRLEEVARLEAQDPEGVKFALSPGAALLLAQKSEGSVRDAVSALDQVVSSGETPIDEVLVRRVLGLADREAFFTLAEAILGRHPKAALAALHAAFEKGLDALDLAQGLSEHLRHLLILKVDPTAEDLVPAAAEDLERMRKQAQGWAESDLLRLLRLASESTLPMRDSPQPLIHLEAAVLQMATLEPGETLAELLSRLEALERRLAGAAQSQAAAGMRGPGSGSAAGGSAARTGTGGGPGPSSRAGSPIPSRSSSASGSEPPYAAGISGAAREPGAVGPDPAASRLERAAAGPVMAASTQAVAEPAPVGLDPESIACWERVIAAVNQRKRMLGAFLQESQFLGLAPHGILLVMDDLHRSVVDERENRALIAAEVARAFGRPLVLDCGSPGSPGASRPPSEQDLQPMIERAITWFEGDLIQRPGSSPESSG